MPVQYEIDVQNQIVKTSFQGVITYRDVADLANQLARDPAFDADFSELATFEQGSDLRLQLSDFQQLSRMDPFSRRARRAYVVQNRGALYGVTRIYQTFRDSPNVQIFHDLEQALCWLTPQEKRAC